MTVEIWVGTQWRPGSTDPMPPVIAFASEREAQLWRRDKAIGRAVTKVILHLAGVENG